MVEQAQELTQYDELTQRRSAAFVAYKAMYMLQNPYPVMPPIQQADWISIAIMMVQLAAAVFVSGSRTVKEFGDVGGAAFMMLEFGMVGYAYVRTSNNYNAERHEELKRWIGRGLKLCVFVMLVANIDAVFTTARIDLPSEVDFFISFCVAVSAPTLAFITGDVLGMLVARYRHIKKQTEQDFAAACQKWNDTLNESFRYYAPKMGATIKVERDVQLSTGQNGHGRTFGRESKATLMVREHLTQNPSDLSMTVRELADKLHVGKSTVANVMREFK